MSSPLRICAKCGEPKPPAFDTCFSCRNPPDPEIAELRTDRDSWKARAGEVEEQNIRLAGLLRVSEARAEAAEKRIEEDDAAVDEWQRESEAVRVALIAKAAAAEAKLRAVEEAARTAHESLRSWWATEDPENTGVADAIHTLRAALAKEPG